MKKFDMSCQLNSCENSKTSLAWFSLKFPGKLGDEMVDCMVLIMAFIRSEISLYITHTYIR